MKTRSKETSQPCPALEKDGVLAPFERQQDSLNIHPSPKVTANCDSWVGGPDWGKCHLEWKKQWEEDTAITWWGPRCDTWVIAQGECFCTAPGATPCSAQLHQNHALAGTFPMAQRLSLQDPIAGGLCWIPGQGTRSYMPQLRVLMLQWRSKIPCAASKTRFGQIK